MNKRLLSILLLSLTALVCAQSAPSFASSAPREHRGFYSSVSFGAAYNWYKSSKVNIEKKYIGSEDWDSHKERELDLFEFGGATFPTLEFKFGTALANLVSFYTVFNLGAFPGTMDYFYEEYDEICYTKNSCVETVKKEEFSESSSDAYNFRTYIGFGSTLYPFIDKASPLNGFFVGGSVGYAFFVSVINDGEKDAAANGGIGFQVEFGKEWWVNDHLSIGVGLGYARTSLFMYTVDSHASDNVISLSFRLTRG